MLHNSNECILCSDSNQQIMYKNKLYHIVLVDDVNYPCYLRLILNDHVAELTDLNKKNADLVFDALYKIEKIIRFIVSPDKINIASMGNITPHLHWHIIPRFVNDVHFPNSIWGDIVNQDYKPSIELIHNQEILIMSIAESFELDGLYL